MASAEEVLAARPPLGGRRPQGRRRAMLRGAELAWTAAFLAPYGAVLVLFALYPIGYGLWMGARPSLYGELAGDPRYLATLANTALHVGFGVNVTMLLAVLLSGFFMRRRRWIRLVLAIFVLPWALPAVPAFLAFHWMLIGDYGLLDSVLRALFGIEGPIWLNDRWLALGWNTIAMIWKWLPFWTVVFLAARMAIPPEIHEAADIDGANATRRFLHVTFPLLANVYLVSTLLFVVWMLGEFTAVHFVSGGAPAMSSDVLATLGMRYAFDLARPELGAATVLSALPVLIPVVIVLIRRVQVAGVQL